MKKSTKEKILTYYLFVVVQTVFYEGIGVFNSSSLKSPKFYEPSIFLDQLIPFIPETIWTYSLYYLILALGFILAFDEDVFDAFFRDLISISLLSDLIFILVPVMITTPSLPPGIHDAVTEAFFGQLIPLDVRGNCFPSLHCAHSLIVTTWLWRSKKFHGPVAQTFALATVLVVVSTLTLKKHWIVDVLGAFGLVLFILSFERVWLRRSSLR